MNYLDALAVEIQQASGVDSRPPDQALPLYRLYALLLLAKGQTVTAEDVHNAWAAWACEHKPDSQFLQPFDRLSPKLQQMDQPFVAAIQNVAHRLASA